MSSRSFTIVSVKTSSGKVKGKANLGGRFMSSTPSSAAKKAASRICRESAIKGQCSLVINLKETTRNSNNKEYSYKVNRVRDPVTVEVKDPKTGEMREVTYNYKLHVKSMR